MPGDTIPNFSNVIAALQLLGGGPGGAQNAPAQMPADMTAAMPGRPGVFAPLTDADRPTWAAFRRLEQENQLLVDHVEMLACALGACPNCWGSIEDCEDCGGIGRPGSVPSPGAEAEAHAAAWQPEWLTEHGIRVSAWDGRGRSPGRSRTPRLPVPGSPRPPVAKDRRASGRPPREGRSSRRHRDMGKSW